MDKYKAVSRTTKRALKLFGRVVLISLAITLAASIWGALTTEIERPSASNLINDVTRLNPIVVDSVIIPTTTEEIVQAVKRHSGPIAIGGGRYSMGGQTATEGALHIDMRRFNRILDLSTTAKTITVQAGTTWRQIIEHIDPYNLSVKVMQTYANFTVGGSLSVNVHGRYMGLGPLILSVRSLKVVLANGTLVEASPKKNRDIFYGVIGGYGGLGVITEATLELTENVKIKRTNRVMPITEYKKFFSQNVRESASTLFHNADIYPDEYDTVNAVSYVVSDEPATIKERLVPANDTYRVWHFLGSVITDWPFGRNIRQHVIDPLLFMGDQVQWRNHEASYDVMELPTSGNGAAYVLQEYFVPVERFDEFVPKLREVLRRHEVDVINISIRHAKRDPGSLLAWARNEVFAFVLYYRQATDVAARKKVGVWTRELIDAALSVDGAYYLPYQPHATHEQFLRAYPRAQEFFRLKKRLDPTYKFRNKLWDKYYDAHTGTLSRSLSSALGKKLPERPGYARDEGQTFLTHPEWYIVYSSDEFAHYLKDRLPTDFPYVKSIGQYWVNYKEAYDLTKGEYPFNWGYHIMLGVIGTSYTLELTMKALYENTVGRLTGWAANSALSDEDRYAQAVAEDYGRFIHIRPWYEYGFAAKLRGLWTNVPWWGDHVIRKWERKIILSLEYAFKAGYASLIEAGTKAAYVPEDDKIQMLVTGWANELDRDYPEVINLEHIDDRITLIAMPRYDVFRDTVKNLATSNASLQILEIAGNDEIFLTGVAPKNWKYSGSLGRMVTAIPLPADHTQKRVTFRVPVKQLLPFLQRLKTMDKLEIDHIYDY